MALFVWARRALNRQKRPVPARAVAIFDAPLSGAAVSPQVQAKTDDDGGNDSAGAVMIGSQKQLLLDDSLFTTVGSGLRFEMHKPERLGLGGSEPVLSPNSEWEEADAMAMELYASVLPKDAGDPDSDFHAWYGMLSDKIGGKAEPEKSEQNGVVGYASISADLRTVAKPILHQHRWMNGTDHNNYLGGLSSGWQGSPGAREGTSVWRDPLRSLGGQFVAQSKLAKGSRYGLGMSTSEDGVTNWTDVVNAGYGPFDTQTTGMWDERNGEYAIFTRGCTHDTQGEKVLGFRCVRRVATCHGRPGAPADDLRSLDDRANCTNQTIVMRTDRLDNSTHVPEDHTCREGECGMPTLDYYGGMVWQYEGVYLMFTQRTWHWSARKYPKTDPEGPESHMYAPGIIDIGLAFSRDGRHFTHLGDREPFLTVGPSGGWSSKMVWLLPSPAARRGRRRDQIYMFYAGTNMDHNGDVDVYSHTGSHQTGINAALLRLDGWVALTAPLHPPSMPGGAGCSDSTATATWPAVAVTKPLRFANASKQAAAAKAGKQQATWRLELNVRTGGGGSVLVELRDGASGDPLPGFGLTDCIPMVVDSVNATVFWAKDYHTNPVSDVSALAASAHGVQVVFQLVGAELYAFQFVATGVP
jgi:hypothetical protein